MKDKTFIKKQYLNNVMKSGRLLAFAFIFLFSIMSVYAITDEGYKQGEQSNIQFTCTVNYQIPSPSATYNFSIYYQNGTALINNAQAHAKGQGAFNYTLIFPTSEIYKVQSFCYDGSNGNFSETTYLNVSPTGKQIDNIGQISVGVIYFFLFMGFGLIFLGYLFLKSNSLWIVYTGVLLMLFGFAFLYYDLHLSNLYATTIAFNSGAGNVTTGAFVMVAKFLKVVPLIIGLVVVFSIVRVLRQSIKKKNSSDGWDGD